MKTEENYINPKRRKCKAFYFNENKNVNYEKTVTCCNALNHGKVKSKIVNKPGGYITFTIKIILENLKSH